MLTLPDIKKLHQSGQFEEAEQGYLALLHHDPEDVGVLHLLGVLYTETGEIDAAQEYFTKALKIDSENFNIQLHLANILKIKKQYDRASWILKKIIEKHPTFSAAFNNLGTIYFAQEKWEDAAKAYEWAIKLQSNYIDAYYNLGLTYNKLNRKTDVKQIYEAILELAPGHVGAHFQLACLLMEADDYASAMSHLAFLLEKHAFHVETKINLANCLLKLGRVTEAKSHYLEALSLSPKDARLFFNLGVIEAQLGRIRSAMDYYLQALKIHPDFFDAHYNLGVLSLRTKGPEVALNHFREALRIEPNHAIVQHLINVLTPDKNLSTLPTDFVSSLFDSYADHYDIHLTEILHYQLPQRFFELMQELSGQVYKEWHILDLGCGTGLCGKYFKTETNKIVGVDLSQKMLDVAALKHVYDELVLADVSAFLQNQHDLYNLIIAGDVLGYIGELTHLFLHINQALKEKGWFVFSAEKCEEKGFHVTAFGRFVYSQSYLDQMLLQKCFHIIHYEITTLRVENNEPVQGHVYVAQK